MDTAGDPAPELRADGLVLRLDAAGAASVVSSDRPEVCWLSQAGPVSIITSAGRLALGPPTLRVDEDEVEAESTADGLSVVVRHGIEAGWDLRLVLSNESDRDQVLSDVRLEWRAGPDCVAVALAGGASATYAVQPVDGGGPVLVGRLRSGAAAAIDESGLVLGPLVLAPGHRWATSWRFEVVPDARRAAGPEAWPSTWLDLDQPASLPAGPDVAVLAPDLGVAEDVEDQRVVLVAGAPGTRIVELRGVRGTTKVVLTWAPDLDELVDADADLLLAGPRAASGTVRIPDALGGLVVQDALARRSVGSTDALAEALDLFAGTLLEDVAADPFALAFLAREGDRTGDPSLLTHASAALLALPRPLRGAGIAGVALALSLVRAEHDATDVIAHLARLRGDGSDGSDDAVLELSLLLGPHADECTGDVLAGLGFLGAALGAGLAGRVVPPAPLERVAYAATLLGLVGEATGERLRRQWGLTAAEVARQAAAQARARTGQGARVPVARRALGWLVLGRPPR